MTNNIKTLLNTLNINKTGRYENHFYIIDLEDSNEYARMYTTLDKHANNTEFPNFEQNSNQNTVKVTNYFEIEEDNITYNIFLFANFSTDKYYIKIGEKN